MSDTATLTYFITAQRAQAKNPNADIRGRWASRIVARGLHLQGMAGAGFYLRDYGRGISAATVMAFAMLAESEECADLAAGFWIAAYTLVTGIPPRRAEAERAAEVEPFSLFDPVPSSPPRAQSHAPRPCPTATTR